MEFEKKKIGHRFSFLRLTFLVAPETSRAQETGGGDEKTCEYKINKNVVNDTNLKQNWKLRTFQIPSIFHFFSYCLFGSKDI